MTKSTRDRIIQAAIELVDEKGYKGATTRAIAEKAGVNEVTLFRQFGSKKGILDAAIEKYSFLDEISEIMSKKIVWDLEKDLHMLTEEYQKILASKRDIILISLREEGTFPDLDEAIKKLPIIYRDYITSYFKEMIDRKRMKDVDAEAAAINFIYINFGYFFLKDRLPAQQGKISINTFSEQQISLFIQSLK